jgi:excisionase family DNA binding protein
MNKLLLNAEEAAEVLGIGRTKVYDLLRVGEIESVRIGGARRIPHDALTNYVERLRVESSGYEVA